MLINKNNLKEVLNSKLTIVFLIFKPIKRFLKSYSSLSHRAVSFSDWLGLYSKKNLNQDKINYQKKWEINKNFQDYEEEVLIKKTIF